MRIGIDFGTSYTAAAAYVDGVVRHIFFRGNSQFRTAVFMPEKPVDTTLFDDTAYDQMVASNQASASIAHSKEMEHYEEAASKIRVYYRTLAKDGDLTEEGAKEQISLALSALRKPVPPSPEAIKKATLAAAKRDWVQQQLDLGRTSSVSIDESAVFGEEAIEEFFSYEAGRLIQSPKSMLGFKLGAPQREAILQIVSNVLRHIRRAASDQLGVEVTEATIGRPVLFRSSMGSEGSDQAVRLLEEAAVRAGFKFVDFLHEPAAAAITYHSQSPVANRTLVVDVGGGTTDITVGLVGGPAEVPHLEDTWGLAKGGTDVDLGLSLRTVMPIFGKDQCSLLAPVYVNAAMVSDLNRQKDFRATKLGGVPAPFHKRLLTLQRNGVTVRLNRDVELLKVALSTDAEAVISLGYIEGGLQADATKTDLERGYERFLRSFEDLLSQVRQETAHCEPTVLFLTGGMSRAPYIEDAVRRHFPNGQVVRGEASLGVVGGLAIHAARSLQLSIAQ
ncbi:Hsp70 family protein [Pseudomonas asiatica]|uniref:Hsp70 family protein n=1 Tax=Pseudomonas asiatica TaxID=2219225 RepID=UPI002AC9142F|nr:Hsp70 family protein [Pseudomonas asiatica]